MGVLRSIESHILPSTNILSYGTPSASVAILDEHGVETHVFTMGSENSETRYLADSVTKSFTAVAIGRLVDEGRLKFDSVISDIVDLQDFLHPPNSTGFIKHVTIEKLLAHTSGLVHNSACDDPSHSPDSPEKHCFRLEMFPGSRWYYDNHVFAILQVVLERACAKPIQKIMRDTVATPLGLSRTVWSTEPPLNDADYTTPHKEGRRMSFSRIPNEHLASRGLWTTPSDLLKLMLALQQSLLGNDSFLQPATTRYMLQNSGIQLRPSPDSEFACLGMYASPGVLAHRGCWYLGGYHSYMFGFYGSDMPDLRETSCAIMTNSFDGSKAIRTLVNVIMYMKRWPRQKQMPGALGADSSIPCHAPEGTAIDPQWEHWIGTWVSWLRRRCEHLELVFARFSTLLTHVLGSLIKVGGQPMFKYGDMNAVTLKRAAMPVMRLGGGKSEVMLTSLELPRVAIRLTWLDEERVIEVFGLSTLLLRRETPEALPTPPL